MLVGTKMYVEGRRDYSGNIPVIFMGENGGWDSAPAVLIDQVNRIVEHTQNNHGRYIVIGLHTGTPEERRELEDAMTAAFGEQYINLREYMCTTGMEDIGMVPTAEDRVDMEQGIAPKSLLKEDLHFTDVGNRVVATAVLNRMEALGYFQKIIAAVKEE